MRHRLETYIRSLSHHRVQVTLVGVNIFLGAFALYCTLNEILPFDMSTFIFVSFFTVLIALYRPTWVFLLLVGMLPYEIVNLAPPVLGIMLRPYQWLMLILLLAVGIRAVMKRKTIPKVKPQWPDMLPILFVFGAFISSFGAHPAGPALTLALILASFSVLYFTVRLFVVSESSALHLLPFVLSSFAVIATWSLAQNILFALDARHFEVMAGRPNGSFAEADWLGMYVLVILSISLAWLFKNALLHKDRSIPWFPLSILFMATLVLILSMARSAWLGMSAMGVFFVVATGVTFWKLGDMKRARLLLWRVGATVLLVLIVVPAFHLSRFPLLQRALSTGGSEPITIACVESGVAPQRVRTIEELVSYGCQHIKLEERELFEGAGFSIETITRDDPNVMIRRTIYDGATSLIQEHPFLGIGWGSIGFRMGSDERGVALNASNSFLEFWLGSGIIGFLAFTILWFLIGFRSGLAVFRGEQNEIGFPLFFHLTWIGLTVFNLFNSGVLLGFFFFFLGMGGLLFARSQSMDSGIIEGTKRVMKHINTQHV